jgi:hypothetical protein
MGIKEEDAHDNGDRGPASRVRRFFAVYENPFDTVRDSIFDLILGGFRLM